MNIDIDIIDDEENLRELYEIIAEDLGFKVNRYSSAEHYLEYVASESYTPAKILVMTDVHMPGKSGYDLIIEIRKINPDQRFVVVTGGASSRY